MDAAAGSSGVNVGGGRGSGGEGEYIRTCITEMDQKTLANDYPPPLMPPPVPLPGPGEISDGDDCRETHFYFLNDSPPLLPFLPNPHRHPHT